MYCERPSSDQFARQTLTFMANLVELDSIAFYRVDDKTGESEFQLLNVPAAFYRDYVNYARDLDPLGPARARCKAVATALLSPEIDDSYGAREYGRFMRSHGFDDTIELFFRSGGELIGGISVLLNARAAKPESRCELVRRCQIAQPYIEHNIVSAPRSSAIRVRESLMNNHSLSRRELAVAELVAAGKCNKVIAETLSIAVTTVKTHLVHIFDKVGVDSRSALIVKINELSQ